MKLTLSPRLQLLFDLAEGQELWDVGCDHGFLAQHNLVTNKFHRVVCVDRSQEVICKLIATVKSLRPEALDTSQIVPVCEDGRNLDWTQVSGAVVVAGMGASAIEKIVRSVPPVKRTQLCWVLSPQRDADRLHLALSQLWRGRVLNIETTTITERGRRRSIFRIKSAE